MLLQVTALNLLGAPSVIGSGIIASAFRVERAIPAVPSRVQQSPSLDDTREINATVAIHKHFAIRPQANGQNRFQTQTTSKGSKGRCLGGSAVERLPSAQGVIPESRD